MKARGEDDTNLLEWMKKKTNKCTCADMQNEILKVMAFIIKILREIAENIKTLASSLLWLMKLRISPTVSR